MRNLYAVAGMFFVKSFTIMFANDAAEAEL